MLVVSLHPHVPRSTSDPTYQAATKKHDRDRDLASDPAIRTLAQRANKVTMHVVTARGPSPSYGDAAALLTSIGSITGTRRGEQRDHACVARKTTRETTPASEIATIPTAQVRHPLRGSCVSRPRAPQSRKRTTGEYWHGTLVRMTLVKSSLTSTRRIESASFVNAVAQQTSPHRSL